MRINKVATPIELVDKQWQEWQDTNPAINHIDTDNLKEVLIKDLTYASQMDVKEYTLYQKWCEIKEKYPTFEASTLFGSEQQLVNPEQQKAIDKIKENIWIPKNADDFMNLQPKMILSNGPDAENWNAARTFISTMKNNSNIGRNLFYLVIDDVTKMYLGVICISSDFMDLTPRDKAIGWSRDIKTTQKMINHTAIGSTIVPFQPLGYNYMGGKLLALLCLSDTVQNDWKRQYKDVLAGVTTTSLYGKTKAGGLSQYDGLEHWNAMGFTSGSVAFEPKKPTMKMVFDWIKRIILVNILNGGKQKINKVCR